MNNRRDSERSPTSDDKRASRVESIVFDHLQRRLDGEEVADDDLIAQYPELMPQLEERLRLLREVADRRESDEAQETIDLKAGHLTVRCPNCGETVGVSTDGTPGKIQCDRCGGSFRLTEDTAKTKDAAVRRHVGHFELVDELGAGSFGSVWKARDKKLDRWVAVKLPHRHQMEGDDAERFLREASAAAQLKHPNIVSVHEVGRANGRIYIVSDFVTGVSLDKWLSEKTLSNRGAAEISRKIALALEHAHSRGVIHRDLKPANILLDTEREPYIMDFGLAKRDAAEVTMTVEGQVLGTPAYMSPEQARGDGFKADARSDVYSLGVILFEMLTGEQPFRGSVRMLLHQVLTEDAPSPRKFSAAINRDMETICLKCLEKEPTKRYASAQALSDDLNRQLCGKPIFARPATATEKTWKWCKRNATVTALIAACILTFATGTVISSVGFIQASRQAATAEQNEEKAEFERDIANRERRLAEWRLYSSKIARAQREWESGDPAIAIEVLDSCRPDLRGWEHAHLNRKFTCFSVFEGHEGDVISVDFDSDGTRIVSASNVTVPLGQGRLRVSGTIKVWNVKTKKQTLNLNAVASTVRFSPNGNWIASGGLDGAVRTWNAESGEAVLAMGRHRDSISDIAFSPDGKQLVSAGGDKKLILWNAKTGQAFFTLEGHTHHVSCVAFSPSGRWIGSGGWDKTVRIWDATTGLVSLVLEGHNHHVSSVCFSSDSKRIVSGGSDRTIRVWDAETGNRVHTLWGHTMSVNSVAASPDGNLIVTGGHDKALRIWDTRDGEQISVLKGHMRPILAVAFSPEGKRIVSGSQDETLRLWDMDGEKESRRLFGHDAEIHCVAFSPDGRWIVSASGDRTLKTWDAITGHEMITLKGHTSPVTCVAVSPDGKTIVSGGRMLKTWDATTGLETMTLQGHTGGIGDVAVSPDGSTIVSGSGDKTIKVWDATSGVVKLSLEGHTGPVHCVAVSPDGTTIVSGSEDKTIKVWNATTGIEKLSLEGHTERVECVAVSPDGKTIASGSGDQTLKLWDANTGEEISSLTGHTNFVVAVAFTPDGQRVLSGSFDHTLKIWSIATGEEIMTLNSHKYRALGIVSSVAIDQRGERIATGSWDRSISLWNGGGNAR